MRLIIVACSVLLVTAAISGCGTAKKAPSTPSESKSNASAPAKPWSPESDCGACHQAEAKSTGAVLASIHGKAGVACMQCHTDEPGLETAHQGATPKNAAELKLSKTTVDEKTCLDCHKTTWEDLAAKTAASTALKDPKGTVVNPHLAPSLNEKHVSANMACIDCHASHSDKTALAYCKSCHHQGTFECGNCHPAE